MKAMVIRMFAFAFLFTCGTSRSDADTLKPEQIARKGKESWAAFQCSIYAKAKSDPIEAKRLFELGYIGIKQFSERY